MTNYQNPDDRLKDAYLRARQKTEELKNFYYSLISYFIVIPFLIYIWYQFTPFTIQWFWFPLGFWGLGLVIQAFKIYGKNTPFGDHWERKQIEKFMKEDKENTL